MTKFINRVDNLVSELEGEGSKNCDEVENMKDPILRDINHLLEVVSLRTRIQMLEEELVSIKSICDHDPMIGVEKLKNVG